MLGTVFDLGAKIGRLAYVNWALGTGLMAGAIVVIAAPELVSCARTGIECDVTRSTLGVAAALVPLICIMVVLTARRLRDAGFAPAIVLHLVVAFCVYEAMMRATPADARSLLVSLSQDNSATLVVKLLFALVLLFWPGAKEKAGHAVKIERTRHFTPAPVAQRERARTARATTFGRRLPQPSGERPV